MKDGSQVKTQRESWSLSADAKVLTIHMNAEMPQGPVEYDLVFTRK